MRLNSKQVEKLSDLFMDLAKGSFLSVITLPILDDFSTFDFLRFGLGGIILVVMSLKLMKVRK